MPQILRQERQSAVCLLTRIKLWIESICATWQKRSELPNVSRHIASVELGTEEQGTIKKKHTNYCGNNLAKRFRSNEKKLNYTQPIFSHNLIAKIKRNWKKSNEQINRLNGASWQWHHHYEMCLKACKIHRNECFLLIKQTIRSDLLLKPIVTCTP